MLRNEKSSSRRSPRASLRLQRRETAGYHTERRWARRGTYWEVPGAQGVGRVASKASPRRGVGVPHVVTLKSASVRSLPARAKVPVVAGALLEIPVVAGGAVVSLASASCGRAEGQDRGRPWCQVGSWSRSRSRWSNITSLVASRGGSINQSQGGAVNFELPMWKRRRHSSSSGRVAVAVLPAPLWPSKQKIWSRRIVRNEGIVLLVLLRNLDRLDVLLLHFFNQIIYTTLS